MGGFGQFRLNRFKQGQKHFSQFQLSLDTDKLKSCNLVCSSLQGGGLLKLSVGTVPQTIAVYFKAWSPLYLRILQRSSVVFLIQDKA